jgi:hypothetical protein
MGESIVVVTARVYQDSLAVAWLLEAIGSWVTWVGAVLIVRRMAAARCSRWGRALGKEGRRE